jgi:alpha-tubulin suppressor-like RCC1 family protein
MKGTRMSTVTGSRRGPGSRIRTAGLAAACALWALPATALAQGRAAVKAPPAPTLTSIAPSEGPTSGGTTVTIDGSGFAAGATVWIGGRAHAVDVRSETQITAVTSSHGAGSYEVIVKEAAGVSTSGPHYTFRAPTRRSQPPEQPSGPKSTPPGKSTPPPPEESQPPAEGGEPEGPSAAETPSETPTSSETPSDAEGCSGEASCGESPLPGTRSSVVGWGRDATGGIGAGYQGTAHGPVATLLPEGVSQIAAAGASYALMDNGTVYAWGDNTFGELGNGSHQNSSVPVQVKGVSGAVAIAAGGLHAMALLNNGTVMTWGGNSYGQLGNGTGGGGREVGEANPVHVPGLSGVVAIAAGGADDVALLANGTLVAWGENKAGQLGDGTTIEKRVPTPVRGLTGVKAVALGGDSSIGGHMLALLDDGTVMAVGGNLDGELGDGAATKNSLAPVPVKGLSGVTAVSADISHSMALLQNGTVMTWGDDEFGQLGVGGVRERCDGSPCSRVPLAVRLSGVTAISAGYRFSLAISGGRAVAWGWNARRQLGQLEEGPAIQPLPLQVPEISEVSQISAGGFHSLALIDESAPAPELEISAGVGSLTVHWLAGDEPEQWIVQWRPAGVHNKWSNAIYLPVAARSYTLTGLSAQPYEVLVRNKNFGSKLIRGTPLSGG